MAPDMSIGDFAEQRQYWRRLERYWRDCLEEAVGYQGDLAFQVKTIEDLTAALRKLRPDDEVSENGDRKGDDHVSNVVNDTLMPAFDRLRPFAESITLASQYDQIAGLVWSGLLSFMKVRNNYSSRVDLYSC